MPDPRIVLALAASSPSERAQLRMRAGRRGFHRIAEDGMPPPGEAVADVRLVPGGLLVAGIASRVPLIEVGRPDDAEPAERRLRNGEPVAVRWLKERVIPLENLVAARRTKGTLWVVTSRPDDVPSFLGALEHGADGVIVEVSTSDDLDRLEALTDPSAMPLTWTSAPVQRVASAGMGDRVIVDTTSILQPEEGMVVGSSAALLLHVLSEAVGSRYTRPRPFRVNAGAAHLYTLLGNGDTRYLSELRAGDAVLVGRPDGPSRAVRVGRIKIERRPMVLVEMEHGGRSYTAFLQEAETVRVGTTTGPVATTELTSTARASVVALPPARHLGVAVTEVIEER